MPTAERTELFGFWLAAAQAVFPGIEIFAVTQMSNHVHLVVRQGEVGDQMYVIIDGKAQVVVEAGGERRHVRDFGRGDVFGEMGLIRSNERTADVVAEGPLEVMTVDQRALHRVQRRYPRTAAQIFLNLAKILSDRLQRETARG